MNFKTFIATWLIVAATSAIAQTNQMNEMNMEKLNLTQECDKTFPQSSKVNHSNVTFTNRFGITLAAECMYRKMLMENSQPLP